MPHAQARGFPSPCVWLADRITSVGQDRLILTRSGAGAPELQRGALPSSRRDLPVSMQYHIGTGMSLLLMRPGRRDLPVSMQVILTRSGAGAPELLILFDVPPRSR